MNSSNPTPSKSAPPSPTVFVDRHLGPDADDLTTIVNTVGYPSLDALIEAAVPASIRTHKPLDLPAPLSETAALGALRKYAQMNQVRTSMIGQGYFGTVTPAVIRRNLLENPAWYTSYTPYQAEISQGRLEALLTFQTVVQDLTGLPVANASLLDEATAVAEAVALMRRAVRVEGTVVIDAQVYSQSVAVALGRAEAIGQEIVVADLTAGLPEVENLVGVVVQQVGANGRLYDWTEVIAAAHTRGALAAVATDLLALALVRTPAEMGADVAVGSAQRFGVPLFGGGPHAAFMAVRAGLERNLPGRLVGVSVDADGAPAYRLALATREQHIRREKATSNICTAQALLAVAAGMYAVYHGADGLRHIARTVHGKALALVVSLRQSGVVVEHDEFFDTVRTVVPGKARQVVERAAAQGVDLWAPDANHVQISCDETTDDVVLRKVVSAFLVAGASTREPDENGRYSFSMFVGDAASVPEHLRRRSDFLTHPVFSAHRSETAMMRFLRTLADKDLALDRTMIPLGSCTMKLNAAVEMEPISWPGFADVHPYAPLHAQSGYVALVADLERWLAQITGYAAVSLQPNAGSQGELAGLLAIRRYHQARNDAGRTVCLIPASAHGTNAASAAMAGFRVQVVATAADGSIDVDDLRRRLDEHGDAVAAIMLTYPSTHGVYEDGVRTVTQMVHDAGGQVYIDGANLNALVGLSRPAELGGDVSHLNLHKTFAIPHGGGGPGVGPVAVAAHLAPYLPGDPTPGAPRANAPVSGTRWGSVGVLPIAWAYIAMMGADGLTQATKVAVAAANYVAARLQDAYPVLYTGQNGLVAHECILDLRDLTARTQVTAEDVAKRLADYGFHAPTLAFPVAGTLMVEPTESEDLVELDRFIAAMAAIRSEIDQVEAGVWTAADSPLRQAPHTATSVVTDDWSHPYSRTVAAYPLPGLRDSKYWPPVRRVNAAYGDRNLVCACPPIESYLDTPAAAVDETAEGARS